MRSPRGFIKASTRGSSYRSVNGTHWIKKLGSKWHLIEMRESAEGRKPVTVAEFKTLTEASDAYWQTNPIHVNHYWARSTN
jgi:hypothetical protein